MAEQQHTYHHHHRKDSATRFKERSLHAIEFKRLLEKWLKISVLVVAVIMVVLVILAYTVG